MAEYILTKKSNLVAVADSVRERTGQTDKITLGEMIDDINYVIGGVELPELTNEGTASDLLAGKQLIDQEGNIVEGTIATKTSSNLTASGATVTVPSGYYATQATKSVATATQATPSVSIDSNGKITATATQTAGYVSAGTKTDTKQLTTQAAKTITPSRNSQTAVARGVYTAGAVTVAAVPTQTKSATPSSIVQNITPDSGKFLSKVTVNAIPSTYIEPTATKTATTYTPTTSNQTIAAGTYCSGAQTIKGDVNLVAENIKSGVSIFGVDGALESSGALFTIENATGYDFIVGGKYIKDGMADTILYQMNDGYSFTGLTIVVAFREDTMAGKSLYYKVGDFTSERATLISAPMSSTAGKPANCCVAMMFEMHMPEYNMFSNITEGSTVTIYIE